MEIVTEKFVVHPSLKALAVKKFYSMLEGLRIAGVTAIFAILPGSIFLMLLLFQLHSQVKIEEFPS